MRARAGSAAGCFFSSRRRHTRSLCDWSSDVCSSDLKKLGVTELGSGTQTLTKAILKKAGADPNNAKWIPVGAGSTFIAAMQQGAIDAGMTTEPTISKVVSSGLVKVLVDLRSPQSTQQALGGN